jgi:hypothetical protein
MYYFIPLGVPLFKSTALVTSPPKSFELSAVNQGTEFKMDKFLVVELFGLSLSPSNHTRYFVH